MRSHPLALAMPWTVPTWEPEHGPKAMPGNEQLLGALGRVFDPMPTLWGGTRAFRPPTAKPHSSAAITSLHEAWEEAGASLPAQGSRSPFDVCREGAPVTTHGGSLDVTWVHLSSASPDKPYLGQGSVIALFIPDGDHLVRQTKPSYTSLQLPASPGLHQEGSVPFCSPLQLNLGVHISDFALLRWWKHSALRLTLLFLHGIFYWEYLLTCHHCLYCILEWGDRCCVFIFS